MWKQFLHILQIVLCLPLFPLIGIPAGGDGGNEDNENEQDENAEDGGEGGGDPDDNESLEDDEQETVTMTKRNWKNWLIKSIVKVREMPSEKPVPGKNSIRVAKGKKQPLCCKRPTTGCLPGRSKALPVSLASPPKALTRP